MTDTERQAGPIIAIADTHLGLLAGHRFYGIRNNSQSDTIGLASFVNWLEQLESVTVSVQRGKWGSPVEIRKPSHILLLGDYLELWDASDAAVEMSSRGIWNALERLSCEKIYLAGNHDFASSQVVGRFPQGTSSIQVLPDTYPSEEGGKTRWLKIGDTDYLFLHGHQFDRAFRYLGRAWVILSYLRDGAEAFRLWSWMLVFSALVALSTWGLSIIIQDLRPFSGLLLTFGSALLLAGALPRMILTVARPLWNEFATARYLPSKALTGFVSWWKKSAGKSLETKGKLCVVYGHTHLLDIIDADEIKGTVREVLPQQLTLINIPSWVSDIREEYQRIFRDAALYIDSNDFHILGWDWRKREPFYIPVEVTKRLAVGASIDEETAHNLLSIGWPEKLLAKIKEPLKILALKYPFNRPAINALDFVDSLRTDDARSEYFEVAEKDHSEYRVYSQSQYLLSIVFESIGKEDLAQAIRRKHGPDELDNDPTRTGHKAGDRFCVLEEDIERFYLADRLDTDSNDEIALLAMYWLGKKHPILGTWPYRKNADRLWKKLLERYDQEKGVLKMDAADRLRQLYPVYKVALLGILAKKMNQTQVLERVREKLKEWQHSSGGWETDLTVDLKPDGVANLETTALAILALVD